MELGSHPIEKAAQWIVKGRVPETVLQVWVPALPLTSNLGNLGKLINLSVPHFLIDKIKSK